MAHRKVTSLSPWGLAELAEQLQIDQLEIIERNRVHEGQELKILGAIGEGKAPTSVPSAASCALEEDPGVRVAR